MNFADCQQPKKRLFSRISRVSMSRWKLGKNRRSGYSDDVELTTTAKNHQRIGSGDPSPDEQQGDQVDKSRVTTDRDRSQSKQRSSVRSNVGNQLYLEGDDGVARSHEQRASLKQTNVEVFVGYDEDESGDGSARTFAQVPPKQ